MIQVHELQKSFGHRTVVQGLSFHAADGEITGLLGANGAGKSTTLRMICGVLTPDSGTLRIDGESPGDCPQMLRDRLGALLDHSGIYSRLTLRENLAYFGQLRGMFGESLSTSVERAIRILDIGPIADRRTAGFSQGERTKTALARAILHSPQNLILDEPTNALDIPAIRSLRELLIQLRGLGRRVLFSSHVLEEVRALCDRVVIISGGRVAAYGSPAEICASTGASSLEEAFMRMTSVPGRIAC